MSDLSGEMSSYSVAGCVGPLMLGRHNQPMTVRLNPDLIRRVFTHVKRCLTTNN